MDLNTLATHPSAKKGGEEGWRSALGDRGNASDLSAIIMNLDVSLGQFIKRDKIDVIGTTIV